MPNLELTELEAKAAWIALDEPWPSAIHRDPELHKAAESLFDKVYRAYRQMPPGKAA